MVMSQIRQQLRRVWRVATVVVVCSVMLAGRARAQATGTVGVTARVAGALSVATQDELAFGTFTAPFAARRVSFTDNSAVGRRGRFTIRSEGDTELMMELTVPDALRNGSVALPLTDWGMRVNTVDADVGGVDTALVPGVNRTSLRMPGASGTNSMLYIRLGATALPGGSQASGIYNATVQVSLNFVGA